MHCGVAYESVHSLAKDHMINSVELYSYKQLFLTIIQIWTSDEGNMEFYGSEATILTEVKARSILLPKIHKIHIADIIGQYLFYYMSNVYG